jgi:hypothetical protein
MKPGAWDPLGETNYQVHLEPPKNPLDAVMVDLVPSAFKVVLNGEHQAVPSSTTVVLGHASW